MKKIFVFFCMALFCSFDIYSQNEKHRELILAYDSKSDSTYSKDTYDIYLYFVNTAHHYYLVLKEVQYLEYFNYLCRFGLNEDEYFVFTYESSADDASKLIYWCTSTDELFSSNFIRGPLRPVETSFKPGLHFINCISFDNKDCGAIHQEPVELVRKISDKDFIGNKLPSSLKIIRKWKY